MHYSVHIRVFMDGGKGKKDIYGKQTTNFKRILKYEARLAYSKINSLICKIKKKTTKKPKHQCKTNGHVLNKRSMACKEVSGGLVPNGIQMEKTLFLAGTVNALFKSNIS